MDTGLPILSAQGGLCHQPESAEFDLAAGLDRTSPACSITKANRMGDLLGQGCRGGAETGAAVQTEPLDEDGAEPGRDSLCLRVLFDSGRPYLRDTAIGAAIVLRPGQEPTPIGRDTRQADGRPLIEDLSVSRQHVAVKLSADGSTIDLYTLNAKNDTFADGTLVQGTCTVAKGSVLRIGGTLLLVSNKGTDQPTGGRNIPGMSGNSAALQKVRWMVSQRADSSTPVSIWGESGVGKELVAEALHTQSRRREKPLVKVNCATLSQSLAASELFGHQKGAFTGATTTNKGLFAEAADGTLFLDEIHWLPTDVQGQLLRALDNGKVRPVGGGSEQEYAVRVVAASNRDLRALSDKSTPPFLPDLRARLGDWYRIYIPPLRERREDILPIFASLLEKEAALRDRGWLLERKLSWRLADALLRRPWANNVRDLRTLAQALVDLTPESATLLSLDPIAEFLPSQAAAEPAPGAASAADLEAPVRLRRQKSQRLTANDEAEIRRSLSRNHGNVKATEAETGVNERTIRRLAEKWRIGNKGDGGGGE